MTADSFWENYKIAHNWMQKHYIAWWKSRCLALERENEILRNELHRFMNCENVPNLYEARRRSAVNNNNNRRNTTEGDEDDLIFQIDAPMMEFLEQSFRHKVELQNLRHQDDDGADKYADNNFHHSTAHKIDNYNLLYGSAANDIKRAETVSQMLFEDSKKFPRSQYWPNIPLN